MSARKSAVMKATEGVRQAADAFDNRRRLQITNQVATINRLMEGGTYETEMAHLHEELAETQARLVDAMLEANRLRSLYEPETAEKAAG